MRKVLVGTVIGLGVQLAAGSAWAQPTDTQPPPPPTEPAPLPPPPKPTVTATATAPAAAAPEVKKDDGMTDHERVIGKFGVGYFGVSQQPIGQGGPGAVTPANVSMPVIGMRYWLRERMGIDAGIGFNFLSSSTSLEAGGQPERTTDGPAVIAFGLHAGLPLVFAHAKHYKFLVVPELNFGYATQTVAQQNPAPGAPATADVHFSGMRFDIGGRVGTEIQFGFIGIPELALQASVGLNFRHQRWSGSQEALPPGTPTASSMSITQNSLGTTVQSDPWALFVNNIAAIYYFP